MLHECPVCMKLWECRSDCGLHELEPCNHECMAVWDEHRSNEALVSLADQRKRKPATSIIPQSNPLADEEHGEPSSSTN